MPKMATKSGKRSTNFTRKSKKRKNQTIKFLTACGRFSRLSKSQLPSQVDRASPPLKSFQPPRKKLQLVPSQIELLKIGQVPDTGGQDGGFIVSQGPIGRRF